MISRGQGRHGGRFRFLALLLLIATFLGCAPPEIIGERHLVPDPLWAQSGREIREGFLVSSSGKLTVEVKYAEQDELLDLLNSYSQNPALFEPMPPLFGDTTPFLMEVTNASGVPIAPKGLYPVLQADVGKERFSMGFPDIYLLLSEDRARDEKMRVLERLLFPSSPISPGNSRKGLLLFGPLDPEARKVVLGISFLHADRTLETETCGFPFVVTALHPDQGKEVSGEKAVEK